jgi:ABC-type sugar transport system ATPase subunit/ribose/xylose/arabinose/galactoside ABC-type transport system permease subunit
MTSASLAPPQLVSLRNLGKRFPGVTALDGVSFELKAGTIHALLGENGAGKSTLINILSGIFPADAGEIYFDGQVVEITDARSARRRGIATVHQEGDLFPDLTVAENWALEHGWPQRAGFIQWSLLRRQTWSALRGVKCPVDPGRLAATLTAGERQQLGIAAALAQNARILILDEPTSSSSVAETETLFEHLRGFRTKGGAILYVSHRLEEVIKLADEATVLRDGQKVWNGPIGEVNADRLITLMVGRQLRDTPARSSSPAGLVRLACRGLTASDGSFQGIDLEVRAGEILGLYGLVGAGRTQWAQGIVGFRPLARGQITVNGQPWTPASPADAARHGIAYLPEDRLRQGLFSTLTVKANAVLAILRRLSSGPFVSRREETRRAQALVQHLAVRLRSLLQPAGTLSGGNQQKVVLGRWLACDPQTLILDEPTRGVDVGSKTEIHALLRQLAENGRALIVISSDLAEVLAHSDRIGVFREGRMVGAYNARNTSAEEIASAAMPQRSGSEMEVRDEKSTTPARLSIAARFGWLREAGVLAAALLAAALLAWHTETFRQASALANVGENAALLGLCGLGAALVIFAGGIDISFGSIMALGAAIAGYLMQGGHSPLLAVSAGLIVATACGALNAALSIVSGVHPIVITLGTMSLYRGLTLLLIGGQDILDVPRSFLAPLRATPFGVPAAVWIATAALSLSWLAIGWTVPGRQLMAFGSNPTAAERTGIHRTRVWLTVFALEGFLAGGAGLLALGLVGSMQSTDYSEKTLEAIGVAVVGGIAITGGRGIVWGVGAAALLFQVLEKGWVLMRISSYWQRTIVGGLLLLAILGDRLWRRRGGEQE